MKKKSLVAFLFLVAVGLVFSGCCQILGSMKSGPADPCQPYEGCFSKDDCKPAPCVERDGCFFPVKCPPPPPPPASPPPPPPPPPEPPKPKKDRN